MNILITGYMGYIGSKLYKKCLDLGHNVKGIDIKENNKNILNILNDDEYTNFMPEIIFHMAALPRVENSIINPSETLKNNTLGTSIMLEYAKKNKSKRFIFSSSSAIYGNNNFPENPYGLQKLQSELECKLYSNIYDLDTVCLRYFNVYSSDQEYGGSYSTAICAWVDAIKNNLPLRLDGDGLQERDFIHVDDIIDANIFCMNYIDKFNGEFFDVGTGNTVKLIDIKKYIDKYNKVNWNYATARINDVKKTIADISKLKKLGYVAKIDFEFGLEQCFKRSK